MTWTSVNFLFLCFAWLLSSCDCFTSQENLPCRLQSPRNESSAIVMRNSSLDLITSVHKSITLSCQFENYCFITWYHNGEMITENSKYQILNEDQELNIPNITMEDAGDYTCTAFNDTHNVSTQGVVTLLDPPEFFNHVSLHYTTQAGFAFTLECRADYFDSMKWYHNGTEIRPSSRNHVFRENNQYMTVQKPTARDAGEYRCVASVGSQKFSKKGFVEISLCDSAEIVFKGCDPGLDIAAELGSNISVKCMFDIGAGHILSTGVWFATNATSGRATFVQNFKFNGAMVATSHYQEGHRDKTCRSKIFLVLTLEFSNVTKEVYRTYYGQARKEQAYEFANVTIGPVEDTFLMIRASAVSGVVLFLTASFILVFAIWKRFHLDIKLLYKYSLGSFRVHKKIQQDGKLYDTYIACSSKDKDISFVINVLMPALTEKGYTVCFREIDFEPGAGIHEEMWRCMKNSRSCVLLLTPDFFQAENLGLSELQVATDTFTDQTNRIIPILREDVGELDVQANPVLKYLVSSNLSLRFKEDCFSSKKKLVSSAVFKRALLALPNPSQRNKRLFGQSKKTSLVDEEVEPSKDPVSLPVIPSSSSVNNNVEMIPV